MRLQEYPIPAELTMLINLPLHVATGSYSPSPSSWYEHLKLPTPHTPLLTLPPSGPDRHTPPLRNRAPRDDPQGAGSQDDPGAAVPRARHPGPAEFPRALRAQLQRAAGRADGRLRVRRVPQGAREHWPGAAQPHDRPQRHGGHDGRHEGADGHDHPQHADYELDQRLLLGLCYQYVCALVISIDIVKRKKKASYISKGWEIGC